MVQQVGRHGVGHPTTLVELERVLVSRREVVASPLLKPPQGGTDEQVELADSLRKWAASLGPLEAARAAEGDVAADFAAVWSAAEEMGIAAIAVPESAGGGGGTVLDQAVALEACARELVPGGLLGAAIGATLTGRPGRYGVQVRPGGVVWDGGTADEQLLLDEGPLAVALGVDLGSRHASSDGASWP